MVGKLYLKVAMQSSALNALNEAGDDDDEEETRIIVITIIITIIALGGGISIRLHVTKPSKCYSKHR